MALAPEERRTEIRTQPSGVRSSQLEIIDGVGESAAA